MSQMLVFITGVITHWPVQPLAQTSQLLFVHGLSSLQLGGTYGSTTEQFPSEQIACRHSF
jgi:hypothetical protein